MIFKKESQIQDDDQNRMKVQITIEFQYLDAVKQFYEGLKSKNVQKDRNESFIRRIVPFFLNQFYHWAIKNKLKQAAKYLIQVKKSKRSCQKKFELGDLKRLFQELSSEESVSVEVQRKVQLNWIDFLNSAATDLVWKNTKIKCALTKQKYIDCIPILLKEISQLVPYDKLLSINKNITFQSSQESEINLYREVDENINQFSTIEQYIENEY